jgi:ParB/RepB/Spo0J family partition protein
VAQGTFDHPDPEESMTATSAPISAPPNDATLGSIDPSLIDVIEAFNPRTSMDDEQLRELTASVSSVGVLQPITIVRAKEGRYRLVVGHRRLAAALAAKVPTVPSLVYDAIDDASKLQFAIIENLQREDMNPVDEAQAYQRAIAGGSLTQKQLASVIGKSASHVSERLRLLKLPDEARALIASGSLPLAAAKPLGQLAALKVPTAEAITRAAAKLLAADESLLDDFLDDATSVLYVIASEEPSDGMPFVYRANSYSRHLPLEGHLPDEQVTALTDRMERFGMRSVTLDQSDIDAARAYGCLIELETRFTPQRFITDAEFLVSRLNEALDLLEKRNAERADTQSTSSGSLAVSAGSGTVAPHGVGSQSSGAADRAREREQAEKDRIAAIHANRDLGMRLAKQLGSRKFDRTVAELLVRMLLSQNDDIAARGVAYTHEDFHELVTTRQKNGKTRTTFTQLDRHEARQRAEEWILRARSAEEVLGRLLQLLVAGVFADERAVAKSKRTHWYAPAASKTEPILAKLARKLLPEHFHERADRLTPKPFKAATSAKQKQPARKSVSAAEQAD